MIAAFPDENSFPDARDPNDHPVEAAEAERSVAEASDKPCQHERELAEVQRIAGVGSWTWDRYTKISTWSNETMRILGIDPAAGTPAAKEIDKHFPPQSRARLEAAA